MYNYSPIVATSLDIDELMFFERGCFKHNADQFSKRSLLHLITSPTSRTILLKDDSGKIYAHVIGLLRHFKIPSGRVYKIGVHPDMKKRGIGSFLIREIEKWFIECGMKKSCAEIRESNKPSRRLFKKNGYVETDFKPFYYAGGENGIKCWKDLCS